MPTYQYACTQCEHRFDAVQSFTDDPLTQCPQCEGRLRKLFNSVGIVFKGSGFYRNDSRDKPAPSADKPAEKSDAKSETKSSGGAESTSTSGDSSGAKTESAGSKKLGTGSSTTGSAA